MIKAFNNILAYSLAELGRPEGSPGRLAIAVAGDDVRSKQIVMDVVNETGFDPVDAGSLVESWRQEPATPAYCCDYNAKTTRKGLAAAVKGEAPKKLQHLIDLYRQRGSNMTHADIVTVNRSLNRSNDLGIFEPLQQAYILTGREGFRNGAWPLSRIVVGSR